MPFLFGVENGPREQRRDSAAFIHCEAQLHVPPRRHFSVFSQLPNLVFQAEMVCIIITAYLLISIFINRSSASELFEHKLDVNPWQDDAEFYLLSQMPLTPHLLESEGIEAPDAGLFA
jgi:hypothetical protein